MPTLWVNIVLGALAVAIFIAVMRYTTQSFWDRQKRRWFIPAVWLTTIVFGLLHLLAFTGASLVFLPYKLCMTLVIFFGGCAIAYLRVNLGFGYGLGMHIFNNLPIIAFLLI